MTEANVALLAPVPLEHLESGRETCARNGKVAFGSNAYDVFVRLDELRAGAPVLVHLYASWDGESAQPVASWRATYIGSVDSIGGAHPDGMLFRPPTTGKYERDNDGHWALFWEVDGLEELPAREHRPVAGFRGLGKATRYRDNFVPLGPTIVEHTG